MADSGQFILNRLDDLKSNFPAVDRQETCIMVPPSFIPGYYFAIDPNASMYSEKAAASSNAEGSMAEKKVFDSLQKLKRKGYVIHSLIEDIYLGKDNKHCAMYPSDVKRSFEMLSSQNPDFCCLFDDCVALIEVKCINTRELEAFHKRFKKPLEALASTAQLIAFFELSAKALNWALETARKLTAIKPLAIRAVNTISEAFKLIPEAQWHHVDQNSITESEKVLVAIAKCCKELDDSLGALPSSDPVKTALSEVMKSMDSILKSIVDTTSNRITRELAKKQLNAGEKFVRNLLQLIDPSAGLQQAIPVHKIVALPNIHQDYFNLLCEKNNGLRNAKDVYKFLLAEDLDSERFNAFFKFPQGCQFDCFHRLAALLVCCREEWHYSLGHNAFWLHETVSIQCISSDKKKLIQTRIDQICVKREKPDLVYFTPEQNALLKSKEHCELIFGYPGTGKTLLMLGNVYQLAMKDREGIFILCPRQLLLKIQQMLLKILAPDKLSLVNFLSFEAIKEAENDDQPSWSCTLMNAPYLFVDQFEVLLENATQWQKVKAEAQRINSIFRSELHREEKIDLEACLDDSSNSKLLSIAEVLRTRKANGKFSRIYLQDRPKHFYIGWSANELPAYEVVDLLTSKLIGGFKAVELNTVLRGTSNIVDFWKIAFSAKHFCSKPLALGHNIPGRQVKHLKVTTVEELVSVIRRLFDEDFKGLPRNEIALLTESDTIRAVIASDSGFQDLMRVIPMETFEASISKDRECVVFDSIDNTHGLEFAAVLVLDISRNILDKSIQQALEVSLVDIIRPEDAIEIFFANHADYMDHLEVCLYNLNECLSETGKKIAVLFESESEMNSVLFNGTCFEKLLELIYDAGYSMCSLGDLNNGNLVFSTLSKAHQAGVHWTEHCQLKGSVGGPSLTCQIVSFFGNTFSDAQQLSRLLDSIITDCRMRCRGRLGLLFDSDVCLASILLTQCFNKEFQIGSHQFGNISTQESDSNVIAMLVTEEAECELGLKWTVLRRLKGSFYSAWLQQVVPITCEIVCFGTKKNVDDLTKELEPGITAAAVLFDDHEAVELFRDQLKSLEQSGVVLTSIPAALKCGITWKVIDRFQLSLASRSAHYPKSCRNKQRKASSNPFNGLTACSRALAQLYILSDQDSSRLTSLDPYRSAMFMMHREKLQHFLNPLTLPESDRNYFHF